MGEGELAVGRGEAAESIGRAALIGDALPGRAGAAIIGVIAYVIRLAGHELGGHAAVARVLGARIEWCTLVGCRITSYGTILDHRLVALAGCAANFLIAAIALSLLEVFRRRSRRAGYGAWLAGHVSLRPPSSEAAWRIVSREFPTSRERPSEFSPRWLVRSRFLSSFPELPQHSAERMASSSPARRRAPDRSDDCNTRSALLIAVVASVQRS